ncbi:MAG: DUF2281 domain-containing protein [Methylobacter sp.]|nr:MAG: DUF2281 domain-containing protein [Methylobacter sp.]
MNTADLIYQESQILPENLRAEVLDFIGYLKTRYAINTEHIDTEKKIAELEAAFAPYRTSFKGFVFNRDEANER